MTPTPRPKGGAAIGLDSSWLGASLPDIDDLGLPSFNTRIIGRFPVEQAHHRPNAPALEFPAERASWTYREFVDDAASIAAGLKALGLEPGDRVGIMLPNRSEFVLVWFASLFCGTIDVGLNHGLVHDALAHQLQLARPRLVVCDADSCKAILAVRDRLPSLETLVVVGSMPAEEAGLRVIPFDDLRTPTSGFEFTFGAPRDITSIRYTSGTTGPAKAVASTNSQKSVSTAMFVHLMGFQADDRLYTPFPLHHSMASMMGVVASFQAGGCCVVDSRFSASQYWSRVGQFQATLGHILDPLVPMLLRQSESPSDHGHKCRKLWTARANPQFETRFHTALLPHYSMSEAAPVAYPPSDMPNRAGSSGRVGRLFAVRIADENDYPVPAGARGEILLRPTFPHTMMAGYFGDIEATASATRGLWFHTGDEGYLDADGFLFLIGRMGDQIRRRGVNIPAEQVENAARDHPSVEDAAAVAVPSEFGESDIKLVLIPTAMNRLPVPDELRRHLAARLPKEMIPRYIEWRTSFPLTPTHKVSKAALRAEGVNGLTESTLDLDPHRTTDGNAR